MARPCGQGSIAGLMRSLPHYHANSLILARAIFSVRIVVKIAATVFQAVPHLADDVDRNEGHPPLLVGTDGGLLVQSNQRRLRGLTLSGPSP